MACLNRQLKQLQTSVIPLGGIEYKHKSTLLSSIQILMHSDSDQTKLLQVCPIIEQLALQVRQDLSYQRA